MSSAQSEGSASAPAADIKLPKMVLILMILSVVFSLAATVVSVIVLTRPVAGKIEESKTEILESLDKSGGQLGKRVDALKDACIDWQAVLKVAGEKPEATFRIIKGEDGLLTLSEVK